MQSDVLLAVEWLGAACKARAADAQGRRSVGVLAEQGRGDHARAITLCAALKRKLPDCRLTLIGHYDGTMAKRDMTWLAQQAGVVDAYIEASAVGGQRLTRGQLLAACRPHFDVLYDAMSVVVKTYYQRPEDTAEQVQADNRLAPYRLIYEGYPLESWRLKFVGESWADLMVATVGLDDTAQDVWSDLALAAPVELAPMPAADDLPPGATLEQLLERGGCADEAEARVITSKPYVVVHSGAGGDAINKIVPKQIMNAIIRKLEAMGLDTVQVGVKGEQALPVQWRMSGLRLPLTNRILHDAVALVDNEGFLAYEALGLGVPAAVLSSVTPHEVYGLPGNLNIIPGLSVWTAQDAPHPRMVGRPRVCLMGTCFWGGGWTWGENWAAECRCELGPLRYRPPTYPQCVNFPRPEDAAAAVGKFIEEKLLGGPFVQEAVA